MPGFHWNTADRLTPITCVTRMTGFVSPNPSDMRVVRTEWSEAMTDAEVSDPSGSVVEILTTDPVGSTGGSG